MPDKTGRLTGAERVFVDTFAATGDRAYAGAKAGYRGASGAAMALARPAVQAEISRVQVEKLFTEGLPLAVEWHIKLIKDPATPAGAKAQAIKLMYDRTIGAGEAGDAKEPHEMTAEEIDAAIAKLRQAAADRARPVLELAPEPSVFE